MDIYKAMGMEWLRENETWALLKNHISENTKYISPGYKYNYRICVLPYHIEFRRCESLSGEIIKTDINFSNNYCWQLQVIDVLKADESAPIYKFYSKAGNCRIPIRVLCPDILSSLSYPDIIEGQVNAFADSIIKLDEEIEQGSVSDAGDNCVFIKGKIDGVWLHNFEFDGRMCKFWEMDVDTKLGRITLQIAENGIDFEPECGDVVCAHALVSMDVAITHRGLEDSDKDPYDRIFPTPNRERYLNGLILNYYEDINALATSVITRDFERFIRCCSDVVELVGKTGKSRFTDKTGVIAKLERALPKTDAFAEVRTVLSCTDCKYAGRHVLAVTAKKHRDVYMLIDTDELGFVNRIEFFDNSKLLLSLGLCNHNPEFHALAMFSYASCNERPYILDEYLAKNCMYRSDYSDITLFGADRIASRFKNIANALDDTCRYSYEIMLSEFELLETDNLPEIYHRKYCAVTYQGGELAYIAFLTVNEYHKKDNIILSCDPRYLKRFAEIKQNDRTKELESRAWVIKEFCGMLSEMRNTEIPAYYPDTVHIWKKADEYTLTLLAEEGYIVTDTILNKDSIGYACERNGTRYAVFMYACNEHTNLHIDGEYCSRLRNEPISQGREVLVISLRVCKEENEDGNEKYIIKDHFCDGSFAEKWQVTSFLGKNILKYYPKKEILDLVPRFISAYNTMDLDALKAIISTDAEIEMPNGTYYNYGFYGCLSRIRKKYGKIKLAYIRYGDIIYSVAPYIPGYAYISFGVRENKIIGISIHSLEEKFRELLVSDENVDYCPDNDVPSLTAVEFLEPTEDARFSMRVTFDNGRIGRYNLIGSFGSDEVERYQGAILTDRIFTNGRISEHIPFPDDHQFKAYSERGQGVEFISGAAISAKEIYYDCCWEQGE